MKDLEQNNKLRELNDEELRDVTGGVGNSSTTVSCTGLSRLSCLETRRCIWVPKGYGPYGRSGKCLQPNNTKV